MTDKQVYYHHTSQRMDIRRQSQIIWSVQLMDSLFQTTTPIKSTRLDDLNCLARETDLSPDKIITLFQRLTDKSEADWIVYTSFMIINRFNRCMSEKPHFTLTLDDKSAVTVTRLVEGDYLINHSSYEIINHELLTASIESAEGIVSNIVNKLFTHVGLGNPKCSLKKGSRWYILQHQELINFIDRHRPVEYTFVIRNHVFVLEGERITGKVGELELKGIVEGPKLAWLSIVNTNPSNNIDLANIDLGHGEKLIATKDQATVEFVKDVSLKVVVIYLDDFILR